MGKGLEISFQVNDSKHEETVVMHLANLTGNEMRKKAIKMGTRKKSLINVTDSIYQNAEKERRMADTATFTVACFTFLI